MATITDILGHMTGLPDPYRLYTGFDGFLRFKDPSGFWKLIVQLPALDEHFRGRWVYNSLAYGIAGMLIESISGKALNEFLEERVFLPLGLSSTRVDGLDQLTPKEEIDAAEPHVLLAHGFYKRPESTCSGRYNIFAANLGVQSCIDDLLIWSRTVIEASELDALERPATEREKILAAVRQTIHPACQISNTEEGEISYCAGWFRTTQPAIDFEIFYDTARGVDTAGSQRASNTDPEPFGSGKTPRDENHYILYSNGYVKGFTSNIHVYPSQKNAVVVLANSTGRSEAGGWVSRLLTSLIPGQHLESQLLRSLQEEIAEFATRWEDLNDRLHHARGQDRARAILEPESPCGNYVNLQLEFPIVVSGGREDKISHDIPQERSSNVNIAFGDQLEEKLGLWHYEDQTYCFFPPREEFERRIMPPFDSVQYLIHFDVLSNQGKPKIRGLW